MKRKVSICVMAVTAVVISVVLLASEKKPAQENTEVRVTSEPESQETEALVETSSVPAAYAYILKEHDGWVVVCTPDSEEIYMETGIRVESLPGELQADLADGIGFSGEEELFDFLESYSS